MISGPKKQLTILLPQELYETLWERSREDGRSLSGYIRQILKRYVRRAAEKGEDEDGW